MGGSPPATIQFGTPAALLETVNAPSSHLASKANGNRDNTAGLPLGTTSLWQFRERVHVAGVVGDYAIPSDARASGEHCDDERERERLHLIVVPPVAK